MSKLVERFFGEVSINKEIINKDSYLTGWGLFITSHPYKTYSEAMAYIEKHEDADGFCYGEVRKKFITEEKEKELLEEKEEVYDGK